MTARDHNKLLSILFFIMGGLQLLGGVIIGLIYGGLGAMMLSSARRTEEQTVGGVFLVMAVVVALIIFALAGLFIFTGWKMRKEQPLGRVLGIISSILSILRFPLGTALGVYGLWFFFGDQGKQFYSGGGNMYSHVPPPPNNWK